MYILNIKEENHDYTILSLAFDTSNDREKFEKDIEIILEENYDKIDKDYSNYKKILLKYAADHNIKIFENTKTKDVWLLGW